ncbi:T3SS effector OspC family protein, partial [Shigella flexneri]|nr:T3SS effector OspC family protein [Shigella flexneri]
HTVDFGANAYIIDHDSPYGYMTLTEHFDNAIPPVFYHEHQSFFLDNFKEVDVNKKFQKANSGDTMLDNAMKSKDSKMIDFLLKNGAVSGKRFER